MSENVTTCTVLDGARGGGGGCSTRIEKLTVLTRLAPGGSDGGGGEGGGEGGGGLGGGGLGGGGLGGGEGGDGGRGRGGRAGHVAGGVCQQWERNAETLSSRRKTDRPCDPWSVKQICGSRYGVLYSGAVRWPLALVVAAVCLGVE